MTTTSSLWLAAATFLLSPVSKALADDIQQPSGDVAATSSIDQLETSGDPDIHLEIGLDRTSAGRHETATRSFSKAIELNPKFVDAYIARSRVACEDLARCADALMDAEEALRLAPHDPLAIDAKAVALAELHRDEEALIWLERALQANGPTASILSHRARIYERRNDFENAERDATRGIELAPDLPYFYILRANQRSAMKRYQDAETDASIGISLDTTSMWGYETRAWARIQLGHYSHAETDLDRAIDLGAASAWTYRSRGYCRLVQGRHRGAESDLTRAIELDPGDSQAFFYRAHIRYHSLRCREAEDDLKSAIGIRPNDPDAAQLRKNIDNCYQGRLGNAITRFMRRLLESAQ